MSEAVSGRDCQCRLCRYDVEFAWHLASVPEEHRRFFEDLKERWEAADFDAEWHRGCIGGEEFTVEFCARYDAEREKVTRRARDRDGARQRGDANAAPVPKDRQARARRASPGDYPIENPNNTPRATTP